MNYTELINLRPGDKIRTIGSNDEGSIIKGFLEIDPLGVGYPVVVFEPPPGCKDGGWLLVKDLQKYHEVIPNE